MEVKLAYIAGFIDGEGCINLINRGKYNNIYLKLVVVNTDMAPLQFISSIFGGNIIKTSHRPGLRKSLFQWALYGATAAYALTHILPYLICKKERAELAIECVGTTDISRQLEIFNLMHNLNKRGVDTE